RRALGLPVRSVRIAAWWTRDYASALSGQLRALVPVPTAGALGRGVAPGRPVVVLLPGVYERWRFLLPLARALREQGFAVVPAPELGWNRRGLDRSVARVAAGALRRVPAGYPVLMIGHSKGGLIGRALLDQTGSPVAARNDVALLTVATPFRGSRYASWFLDPAIRHLRPSDPSLTPLAAATPESNARVTALVPRFDPHVPTAEPLPGARTRVIPVPGHFWSVRSRQGVAIIVAEARAISDGLSAGA
ncbi:esterase/lipase family protein, partial [Leucobacter sp. M11]|uniref:esterase/lipase family protein n=1 Tax=Leucobacter sp. M11 TaxID=2993565 RepID=UPI002D807823